MNEASEREGETRREEARAGGRTRPRDGAKGGVSFRKTFRLDIIQKNANVETTLKHATLKYLQVGSYK
jgi:hypothetical protein